MSGGTLRASYRQQRADLVPQGLSDERDSRQSAPLPTPAYRIRVLPPP